MKKIQIRDYKKRVLVHKFYKQRLILKSIIYNLNYSVLLRKQAFVLLLKYPTNSGATRVRNLCLLTYRSRSVSSKFKVSRLSFKRLINKGLLSSIKIASW